MSSVKLPPPSIITMTVEPSYGILPEVVLLAD